MKPTDKRFWIWVIAVTMLLSAMPMIMYGENIIGIILIILSYFIASAICLRMASVNNKVFTWFMLFCASCGAYIIDIILIDSFRLVKMESYPLIVGQIYLFPISALTQGLICLFGGIIMSITNKKHLHKNMCSSKILILFLLFSHENYATEHIANHHRIAIEKSVIDNKWVTKMDFICRKQFAMTLANLFPESEINIPFKGIELLHNAKLPLFYEVPAVPD